MRAIKLTAAIITICVGAVLAYSCVSVIAVLSSNAYYIDYFGADYTSLSGLLIVYMCVFLLYLVALIVLGSMFCRRKKDKGICIALLVLVSILTFIQFIGLFGGSGFAVGIFDVLLFFALAAVLVLCIIYLVQLSKLNPLKTQNDVYTHVLGTPVSANNSVGTNVFAQALSPQQHSIEQARQLGTGAVQSSAAQTKQSGSASNNSAVQTSTAALEEKLGVLKQLKEEGIITEKDFAERVAKLLDGYIS